jgi:hypothetical protein
MAFDLQGALQQYNAGGAASDLTHDFQTLAPGVTTVGQESQGATFNPGSYGKTAAASGSTGVTGFLGNIFHETGHLAGSAATWLGHTAVSAIEAPFKLGSGVGHGILDHMELGSISQQNSQLSAQMHTLQTNFKSGKLSRQDYTKGLKDLSQEFDNLTTENKALNNRIAFDQKASTGALINTASDLVTILTAGFGKAVSTEVNIAGGKFTLTATESKTAGQWLTSKAAEPMLSSVEQTIQRVASQPEVFKLLDANTQELLQKATAEVVANTSQSMTASQIARATAANVALKYPMTYSYIAGTGADIYHELDQGKYGDAVRTLAFNAALLLSGGPIGHALKYGGKVLGGIGDRTFGQTSFWDELSKFYGDKNPAGFTNAIREYAGNLSETDRKEFIKNLSAVEATNTAAVGGDAKAGAYRLAKGMQGQYAFDLGKVSHGQAIEDMVNFAKSFREISDMAKHLNLGPVAVGRLDARDKQAIAEAISGGPDAESRLNAWNQWKADNPNAAAANNVNFDKQVKDLINQHADDAGALQQSILDIKARTTVQGFPESFLNRHMKQGYIPIQPKNLQATFKEGTDKLVTKFAHGDDFFIKAVQPLPVLGSVGGLLTRAGLSPNAAQARTYQLFNDALARNLAERYSVGKVSAGDLSLADSDIKALSDFANTKKLPITDMRMLTVKNIQEALGTTKSEAKRVQDAIARSHLDVPLAVKGLGDRAVDWTYKLPISAPVARQYLKIQGAMRFSFNPFFQYLRVIPKTEILSQAEGGGYISAIFQGRGKQIGDIRTALHDGGFLDTPSRAAPNGEAIDAIGSSQNLHKHLLPAQEHSIAGLVDAQAQRMGMDAQTYMATYPNQVRDTVQMIAEYDRNADFLNSPLARTLNIAFFPFRFDVKVAAIFARNLGKSSLITQVAVVHGMLKAHDFLTSPEGQAWYAQNATVLGLINYVTPFAHLSEAFQSMLPGHDHSLGNFGELGGLPFGWIPQLLDAEGLTHFNQPGMSATTGKMFPDYVPATDRGQLAVAVQDLIGGLFSYPGAMIGLPSKNQLTGDFANAITGASKSDSKKVTPEPNAQQQYYQQNSGIQDAQPVVHFSTGQPSSQPIATQMGALPPAPPKYKEGKASVKKKKESQYTPALLLGQSTLGQL